MTPREIILANIEHSGTPRPGITFNNGDSRINDMHSAWIGNPAGYTPRRWIEGDREYYDDAWGNLWVRMKDGCAKGEICKPAIEEWSQLNDIQPLRYNETEVVSRLQKAFLAAGTRFKLAGIGGWIFDNARYMRKLEIYLMDMALYPEELHKLHAIVAKTYETRIHLAGKGGADGIMIGEDMGTQAGLLFSPDMWRVYFQDEYTRLFSLAHEYGMKVLMHSCGQNLEIIPDLIKAGVDVFQFDQPAVYDMPALAKTFRENKRALWSPIDIQKILPTGDKSTIEQGAKEMLDIFAGGLIVKNYPDLRGIGVDDQWDAWGYEAVLRHSGIAA